MEEIMDPREKSTDKSDSESFFSMASLSSSSMSSLSMGAPEMAEENVKTDALDGIYAPDINVIKQVYERRKLKEKSLPKVVRPTCEKKASRSCLPISIKKVCKIKKKPSEKRKEMPTNKSLKRKKFSPPTLFNLQSPKKERRRPQLIVSDSDPELHSPDEEVENFLEKLETTVYTPVSPEMLVRILNCPLLFRFGASLDLIMRKLRAIKDKDFNPNKRFFKDEVKKKLRCAEKLGMVTEQNGHYWLTDDFRASKLSRREVDAFWNYYCSLLVAKNCAKVRRWPRNLRGI